MLQNYNLGQSKRVSVIRNWLGKEGLQLIVALTKEEQDLCSDEKSLFEKYLSLIDAGSGYHNLKLDDRLSYLTTHACQFDMHRYKRLQFGAGPVGNMFQHKINGIFKDLPNVFGICR